MIKKKHKIIIIGAAALLAVAAVLILIGRQEHDVTFTYYDTFLPLDVEGQQYIIDDEHTSMIDHRSHWGICNIKQYNGELKELDFTQEAYIFSQGKPIKRIYYKTFDTIELTYKKRGHILYIEFEDVPLIQKKYTYVLNNTDGPYCTEHEAFMFD